MPELSIRLQRGRDGPDVISCVRADGSRTWQRLPGGLPVHDLMHYAVEKVLGLRDGFYGLVARGWNIPDFYPRENRDKLPSEAGWEEFVVALLQTEMSDGIERSAAEFNSTLADMLRGGGCTPSRELTEAELAAIRRLSFELATQWWALAPGGAMDLKLECAQLATP
jgi:hypothetical protein